MNKILRLVLAGLVLAGAVWLFIDGQIGNGIMVVLLSGLIVFSYFRNEHILISFWHMRKNNFEKAEKSLDRIKNPEKSLVRGQQAYWYMLKGMIESQRGIGKAESLLRKSLSIGLRMKHDQAMAKLQLAGIAIAKRRKREAMILLSEVKKLDSRGLLNEQVKMIKQQMKRI
jgi:hypothetical protein